MIKHTFILVLCFIGLKYNTHAQTILPVNSSGKIEFIEVVEIADSIKKEKLFQNAALWIQAIKKNQETKINTLTKDSLNNKISVQMQFSVYQQTGVLKKMTGVVTYSLTLEVKDFKYRYSFTDFVYHYYAQNKNYQVVPTGRTKNLEESKAPGWNKLWIHCRAVTGEKIYSQINSLKIKMIEKDKAVTPAADVKKSDW